VRIRLEGHEREEGGRAWSLRGAYMTWRGAHKSLKGAHNVDRERMALIRAHTG
jgi:hypothetical protein